MRLLLLVALACAVPASASAQPDRLVEFSFTPALPAGACADMPAGEPCGASSRAQIALWIERADGTYVRTLRLTEGVAVRGIGNRPGSLQMNSGYRWPYGRREGALPVWGHARASAPGAELFPRVIFQNRISEGCASRTSSDQSRDDYFCLSFNRATTTRDELDAVSCASIFSSDKGRYLTEDDVRSGYGEAFMDATGTNGERALELGSIYPPRRDVVRCDGSGCFDHEDVDRFTADARRIMPEIDAVTMATPTGDSRQTVQLTVPAEWPDGDYVAFLEVNVEGDYNATYNDDSFPTPTIPDSSCSSQSSWDFWAQSYGYAYRGQPSVIFRVPFALSAEGGMFTAAQPYGYGSVHGETGDMTEMDGSISNDPVAAPGSGADRLRAAPDGTRFAVRVIATSVCSQPEPPPECFSECDASRPCDTGFICGDEGTCIGICDIVAAPSAVPEVDIQVHGDEKQSHRWALLSFRKPESGRDLTRYEVRVSRTPILTEADYMAALPAKTNDPSNDDGVVALEVPVDATQAPGDAIGPVVLAELLPETTYFVAVRAYDMCNSAGPFATAEITTTAINFTTVSPCFVATAAYGTPMADEIGALRRFRDRHLMNHAAGRALVDAYYAVGPTLADAIRGDDDLRALARTILSPLVSLVEALDAEPEAAEAR